MAHKGGHSYAKYSIGQNRFEDLASVARKWALNQRRTVWTRCPVSFTLPTPFGNNSKTLAWFSAMRLLLSPAAIELGLQAFIRVTLNKAGGGREKFDEAVQGWQEILSCFASQVKPTICCMLSLWTWNISLTLYWKCCSIKRRRTRCSLKLCIARSEENHCLASEPFAQWLIPI